MHEIGNTINNSLICKIKQWKLEKFGCETHKIGGTQKFPKLDKSVWQMH